MEGPLNKANNVHCIVIHALHLTVFYTVKSAPTHTFLSILFLDVQKNENRREENCPDGFVTKPLTVT